jgi:hypothetical protein
MVAINHVYQMTYKRLDERNRNTKWLIYQSNNNRKMVLGYLITERAVSGPVSKEEATNTVGREEKNVVWLVVVKETRIVQGTVTSKT